jgi:hypothetical protein
MRLRETLENIVYAGMNRRAPSDPLYLSNKRWSGRLKPLLVLGVPCLALVIGVEVAASRNQKAPPPLPTKVMPMAKLATVSFPSFDSSRLEVLEVTIHSTHGIQVVGSVRNRSQQVINLGRVALELQDADGQFTESLEANVSHVQPGAVARFEMPVQPDVRRVLVTGIAVESSPNSQK